MHFNIITLFPEFFASVLHCGLLGKALEQGMITIRLINPRDFSQDRHRTVDDRPYGGGPGMVMTLPPLALALRSLEEPGRMALLCPKGRPLDHELACSLAGEQVVTLICGRYEGIDHRLESLFPVETISVGGVVLNGGETPALQVVEAVSRLLPGFMGHQESFAEETFVQGLLEYPHYTRPEVFEGVRVPEVLLSGDHARIAAWRRKESLRATLELRPDLLREAVLKSEDTRLLRALSQERPRVARNCFLALVHAPVLNKFGQSGAVSLTNLDIHDIARCSRTYGIGGYFVCTPLQDQQQLAARLLDHWLRGPGAGANPDRGEALRLVRIVDDVEQASEAIARHCGQRPLLVATSAREGGDMTFAQVRELLEDQSVLLVLGTGYGLAPEVQEHCSGTLRPVRMLSDYNHLSVRAAAAIILDRILGDEG
ncbi:tRNA (guanosine(37)-N1)-methyltransferase TrmD [Desulfonatronum thioautotrophicum]|uniref:tRNA (guanosine(37)-N1)-methyltransferase TrmD n=1 Tax=Desulfonatronum thioautotrophicum TaxID=617001 RepID=UPI0005EBBC69|nr:tRNA (guanosine(37)-N1)-methyltransferase TrmD [Desulfonatronum thioautotrophicum]